MQVVSFGTKLNTNIVLCLGYFGCMHLGHIELVKRAKQMAADNNCQVALFTFENDVLSVQGKHSKAVFTYQERLKIYQDIGIDIVITANFDDEFRQTKGHEFLSSLMMYNLKGVVFGFDYTCGNDKMNSDQVYDFLACKVPVQVVDAVVVDNTKISTSLVASLIGNSDIDNANKLLTQSYFISGNVVKGRHVGSTMGFPTANIAVNNSKLLPIGVFAGYCNVDGKSYKCIVNIGAKPTFEISTHTIEVHLLDYCGNLYGTNLTVQLTKRIREIIKFDTVEQLIVQLLKDKEAVLDD